MSYLSAFRFRQESKLAFGERGGRVYVTPTPGNESEISVEETKASFLVTQMNSQHGGRYGRHGN
jgi:hypothetical protein